MCSVQNLELNVRSFPFREVKRVQRVVARGKGHVSLKAPFKLGNQKHGLPVAMERKLALMRSAALRERHWDGTTRPSKLILELQVAANQPFMLFVVKVRRNLFPTLAPLGRTCCSVKVV